MAKRRIQKKKNNSRVGSDFDDFLAAEDIQAEVSLQAIKEVIAWQVSQEMQRQKLTKVEMARRMRTSRSALDRLLSPRNTSMNLDTMDRAARVLGKRVRFDLVDAKKIA